MTIRVKVPDFSNYEPQVYDDQGLNDLCSREKLDASYEQRLSQLVELTRRILDSQCALIGLVRDGRAVIGTIAGGEFEDPASSIAMLSEQIAAAERPDGGTPVLHCEIAGGLLLVDGTSPNCFAGITIRGVAGVELGFLGILDHMALRPEAGQREILRQLAGVVQSEIEARAHVEKMSMELQARALLDIATGLPNLAAFSSKLERLVEDAASQSRTILLALIRVEGFEALHAALGRPGAVFVMEQLARRLRNAVPAPELIGQMRDDILAFALQLPDDVNAHGLLEEWLDSLTESVELAEHIIRLRISIGASVFPKDADNAESLMKRARTALWSIGPSEYSRYSLYQRQQSNRASWEFQVEAAMRYGLSNDEFSLVYQPKIALHDNRVIGAEALVRWTSSRLGEIPPTEFIPIAERTGLIGPLGIRVLEDACGRIQKWLADGLDCPGLAVNITSYQLRQPRFVRDISDLLTRHDRAVDRLDLELTEGSLVEDIEGAIRVMRALRQLGVTFSIDDFGTGFSSLSYLRQMPIGVLKIDRSFVKSIPESREDMKLVRSIISMGHDLGLRVVAEGVETGAQVTFLKTAGCDQVQGYFFSPPLTEVDFVRYLLEHQAENPVRQSSA